MKKRMKKSNSFFTKSLIIKSFKNIKKEEGYENYVAIMKELGK